MLSRSNTSRQHYLDTTPSSHTFFTYARTLQCLLTPSLSPLPSLARYPLAFEPGTDWYYGDGFDVLGHVCEAASPPCALVSLSEACIATTCTSVIDCLLLLLLLYCRSGVPWEPRAAFATSMQ